MCFFPFSAFPDEPNTPSDKMRRQSDDKAHQLAGNFIVIKQVIDRKSVV